MSLETEFFRAVAARSIVRVRVAALVISEGWLLVQRPADDPEACYAFPGGEYELGDTFESRLSKEFDEETTGRVTCAEYRFVVENRFKHKGMVIQNLEHFFEVQLDRRDVSIRESHLSLHWLPVNELSRYDLRPHVVRDSVASGEFRHTRHLVVPFSEENT